MKSTLISNAEQRPESRISRAIVKEIWNFFSLIEFYKLKFNKTSMNAYLVDWGLLRAFSNMKRQYTVIYLTPKTRLCLFATILTWQAEAPLLSVTSIYFRIRSYNVNPILEIVGTYLKKSDIWQMLVCEFQNALCLARGTKLTKSTIVWWGCSMCWSMTMTFASCHWILKTNDGLLLLERLTVHSWPSEHWQNI